MRASPRAFALNEAQISPLSLSHPEPEKEDEDVQEKEQERWELLSAVDIPLVFPARLRWRE